MTNPTAVAETADNRERFLKVCEQARPQSAGIGTLGEKRLHAVLKHYYEPRSDRHEIKVDSFVADIVQEDGIIEIQTRGFDRLRKKLEVFLQDGKVTVVYPVAKRKWLCWIDTQTGEVTKRRKSPKTGTQYAVLPELYKIKWFLGHKNLTVCIVLLELEEYRYLDGWSHDKKKGSTRYERFPLDIYQEVYVGGGDWSALVPAGLPEQFTTKDYAAAAGISRSHAQTAMNILHSVGVAQRVGKTGNQYLYRATLFDS